MALMASAEAQPHRCSLGLLAVLQNRFNRMLVSSSEAGGGRKLRKEREIENQMADV